MKVETWTVKDQEEFEKLLKLTIRKGDMYALRRLMEMREKQQIEAGMGGLNAVPTIPYEPPTLKQTLLDRRAVLVAELNKIDEALHLYESEPRVTDAIEIIMKAVH